MTGEFWKELIEDSTDPELSLKLTFQPYTRELTFRKSDLYQLVGPLNPESWRNVDSEKNLEAQAEKRDELRHVRSADIQDLITGDLTVDGTPEGETFDSVAQTLFGKGLAYQLLRSGYINRNFTLYTATFHGDRLSPAATNFIIHHIERDSKDENFQLTGADVDALIRERPNEFNEPAFYNIDILDHILRTPEHEQVAKTMVASLVRLGKEQKEFLQAYLSHGAEQRALIKRMAPVAKRVFTYLAKDVQLDDRALLEVFSMALRNVSASTDYVVDEAVSEFIISNYQKLEVLASEELDVATMETIAVLAARGCNKGAHPATFEQSRKRCLHSQEPL